MSTTNSLVWQGEAVTDLMRKAQVIGINRVMVKCVRHAQQNHTWENQEANLQRGINIVASAAPQAAGGVKGIWGVKDVAYARIHELGGTIVPKRAKFLTIPISDEAKRAGRARAMSNLAYVQSIKGQPMLVDQHSGEVHWLLVKSVTIKAQPYLRPAGDMHYPSLGEAIREAYDKAGAMTGGANG